MRQCFQLRAVRSCAPGSARLITSVARWFATAELAGWVFRPCRNGYKIGPLVGDDRGAAEAVLSALLPSAGRGEIFLDVPSINQDAIALAQGGLAPTFETARMYTGPIPPLRLERLFGVTTFELG